MLLKGLVRLVNRRCPACFEPVGPEAVRYRLRLYCSQEHLETHVKLGKTGGK